MMHIGTITSAAHDHVTDVISMTSILTVKKTPNNQPNKKAGASLTLEGILTTLACVYYRSQIQPRRFWNMLGIWSVFCPQR